MAEYEENLKREMEAAAERRREALDVFFDDSAPLGDRLEAFKRAGTLRRPEDIERGAAILRDEAQPAELRVAALEGLVKEVGEDSGLMSEVIALIRSDGAPDALRETALAVMQGASFSSAVFPDQRPAYFDAMRGLVEHPDASLRRPAQENLALAGDEYVQRRLLEGIEDPARQIAEPEVAIQLLSYDLHADHFPVLRKLAENPPNERTKQEALRNLAADTSSKDLLLATLRDTSESAETRELCAVALQSQNAPELETYAKELVLADDEDDDLRAAMLNTLAHISPQGQPAEDPGFHADLEKLILSRPPDTSDNLMKSFRQFDANVKRQQK